MDNPLLNNGNNLGLIINNINSASGEISRISERLASGSRISRASDDPASVILDTDLKSKSRLYSKAARNVSDAISVTNVMQSSLDAQNATLLRMQELASLAQNSSLTTAQRSSYDEEYKQLLGEYTRIAHSAEFNGQKLLRVNDPDNPDSFVVQAGITGSSGDTVPVTLADTTLSGNLDDLIPTFSQVTNTFDEGGQILIDWINLNGSSAVSWTEAEIQSFAGSGTAYAITSGTNGGLPRDVLLLALGGNGDSVNFLVFERNTSVSTRWDTFITPIDALRYGNSSNNNSGEFGWNSSGQTIKDLYSGSSNYSDYGTIIDGDERGGSFALNGTTLNATVNAASAFSAIETVKDQLTVVKGTVSASAARLETSLDFVNQAQMNVDFASEKITEIDVANDVAKLTSLQVLQNSGTAILASANQSSSLVKTLLQV